MGFLRSVLSYAATAWNFLLGISGDVGNALIHLFRFIGAVHSLLDHLVSRVLRDLLGEYFSWLLWLLYTLEQVMYAVARIESWVIRHIFRPLYFDYIRRIARLKAWVSFWFTRLYLLELRLYAAARAYALALFTAERNARIKAVNAEHAAMLAAVARCLQTVQNQASTGYKDGSGDRVSAIAKITDDLAARNPVLRGLINDLVGLLLDVIGAENPVERAALSFLLTRIINRLGVDRVAGDLLATLIGNLAGAGQPRTLHDVIDDLAKRTGALENQWAQYMADGGPELTQAGREWKNLTGLATDAALLAFFGAAVADPTRWARDVSATAGAAVNDTIGSVSALLRRM